MVRPFHPPHPPPSSPSPFSYLHSPCFPFSSFLTPSLSINSFLLSLLSYLLPLTPEWVKWGNCRYQLAHLCYCSYCIDEAQLSLTQLYFHGFSCPLITHTLAAGRSLVMQLPGNAMRRPSVFLEVPQTWQLLSRALKRTTCSRYAVTPTQATFRFNIVNTEAVPYQCKHTPPAFHGLVQCGY